MQGKGYIVIPDWMLDLELDVYETIILATIYGFSQDGDSRFKGSQNYLARKAKCSRKKVALCLSSLMEKGLISKYDKTINGVHLCDYAYTGCECGTQGVNEVHNPCECHAHNNIEDNIDNNTLSNNGSRFSKPCLQEIVAYCEERRNSVNAEAFFNFYESNGWKVGKSPMKDWKAAIRTWEQRAKQEKRTSPTPPRKESAYEHNLRVADEMFGTNYHEQIYGKK